jgi:hypothetical protein
VISAVCVCCSSIFNSPLSTLREATTFYRTELRCVVIHVSAESRPQATRLCCRHHCHACSFILFVSVTGQAHPVLL